MTTETRTRHPYYMYDAIMAQPHACEKIAANTRNVAKGAAAKLAGARYIYLVGIGTSSHAAQVGHLLFREAGVTAPVQALHAFDFALYGPKLAPEDAVIVISHRGGKRYSLESIKRAHEAGCYTVLITGEGEPPTAQYASETIKTVGQDKSSAHTVSYCGAIVVLACLAEAVSREIKGIELHPPTFLAQDLPALLAQCLNTEAQVKALATAHLNHRRIWIVGGGPSGITAQEIALKIKEASYLQAEGMPVEVMMHGPFQCVEPEDLCILIAPSGPAQMRTSEFSTELRAVGVPYLLVDDGSNARDSALYQGAAAVISVPPVTEALTALTCLLPLQLFSYYLALARGTNPDGFRLEDPRFAQAYKQTQL